jgi:hypothetical protein
LTTDPLGLTYVGPTCPGRSPGWVTPPSRRHLEEGRVLMSVEPHDRARRDVEILPAGDLAIDKIYNTSLEHDLDPEETGPRAPGLVDAEVGKVLGPPSPP